MKKVRLLLLAMMLVGGGIMFNSSASVIESCGAGGEGCPVGPGGPNGCRCCSDNQCDSGYCGTNDKCAKKPDGPPLEEILD